MVDMTACLSGTDFKSVPVNTAALRSMSVILTANCHCQPHAVEFEDIVKSYNGKPVIRGLSLALPVNRTTAIVGESGQR